MSNGDNENTMTSQLSSGEIGLSNSFKQALRAPLHPQTYRNLAYLMLMFPLGVFYFNLLIVGFATGIPLLIVGVGIPITLILFVLIVELAGLERRLVRWLLDVDPPAPSDESSGSLWTRSKQLVTAYETWKAVVYLLSEFAYGTIMFGIVGAGIRTSVSFLLAPTYYTEAPVTAYGPILPSEFILKILFGWDNLLIGLTGALNIGTWRVETLTGALFFTSLGIVLLWGVLFIGNAAARLWGQYARRMLTSPRYWTIPDLWSKSRSIV